MSDRIVVTFRDSSPERFPAAPPMQIRLRQLLKFARRRLGLQCTSIIPRPDQQQQPKPPVPTHVWRQAERDRNGNILPPQRLVIDRCNALYVFFHPDGAMSTQRRLLLRELLAGKPASICHIEPVELLEDGRRVKAVWTGPAPYYFATSEAAIEYIRKYYERRARRRRANA